MPTANCMVMGNFVACATSKHSSRVKALGWTQPPRNKKKLPCFFFSGQCGLKVWSWGLEFDKSRAEHCCRVGGIKVRRKLHFLPHKSSFWNDKRLVSSSYIDELGISWKMESSLFRVNMVGPWGKLSVRGQIQVLNPNVPSKRCMTWNADPLRWFFVSMIIGFCHSLCTSFILFQS